MEEIEKQKNATLDLITNTLRLSGMGNREVQERMEGLGINISEPLITDMRKGRRRHEISFHRVLAWYSILGITYQFPCIKTKPSQANRQ